MDNFSRLEKEMLFLLGGIDPNTKDTVYLNVDKDGSFINICIRNISTEINNNIKVNTVDEDNYKYFINNNEVVIEKIGKVVKYESIVDDCGNIIKVLDGERKNKELELINKFSCDKKINLSESSDIKQLFYREKIKCLLELVDIDSNILYDDNTKVSLNIDSTLKKCSVNLFKFEEKDLSNKVKLLKIRVSDLEFISLDDEVIITKQDKFLDKKMGVEDGVIIGDYDTKFNYGKKDVVGKYSCSREFIFSDENILEISNKENGVSLKKFNLN